MLRRLPPSLTWLRALLILWLGALAGFAGGAEWIRRRPAPPPPSGGIDLTGAGATFPFPLYRRWFEAYAASTGVRINYFSVGSTAGLTLMLADGVDFGASDRPLDARERGRAVCRPLEVPMAIGGVAVIVHLPGLRGPLHLDPEVLAEIHLGTLTRWDDARLVALNPTATLPPLPIRPVHRGRASGSGTATLLDAYLSRSARWRESGHPWAAGDSVEGNEGVAAQVQAVPGSVGFVEASYADHPRLRVAALRNHAGAFVRPDPAALAVAAEVGLRGADADTVRLLDDGADPRAYPVAGLTRLVAVGALRDAVRARHFLAFARWALREGTPAAEALGFAPLPTAVQARLARRLDAVVPGRCEPRV